MLSPPWRTVLVIVIERFAVHGINATCVTVHKPPFSNSRIMLLISVSLSITKFLPEQRVDQGGMIQLDARSSTSTSTKNSQNKTMHRSGRSAALNLRNHFGGHSVMVAVRQLTVSLSCLQALESQMKILTVSRSTLASTLICGAIFAAIVMVGSCGRNQRF